MLLIIICPSGKVHINAGLNQWHNKMLKILYLGYKNKPWIANWNNDTNLFHIEKTKMHKEKVRMELKQNQSMFFFFWGISMTVKAGLCFGI